jgi:hypothetical protein
MNDCAVTCARDSCGPAPAQAIGTRPASTAQHGRLLPDRESFVEERRDYVEKLMSFNRKVGELETQLRQLSAPENPSAHLARNVGEK